MTRHVASPPPAPLAASAHGDFEAAAAAHKGKDTTGGSAVVAVAIAVAVAEAACGATFEHRYRAVVLRKASRVLRENVDECLHCRERVFVRYPFQFFLCNLLRVPDANISNQKKKVIRQLERLTPKRTKGKQFSPWTTTRGIKGRLICLYRKRERSKIWAISSLPS